MLGTPKPDEFKTFAEKITKAFSRSYSEIIKFESKSTGKYIEECEALRGIAIALVVFYHGYLQVAKQASLEATWISAFIMAGNSGVTLFFVLSGFLLNLPLVSDKPVNFKEFYVKRLLRIMPMYSIMVIIGGLYNRNFVDTLKSLLFIDINLTTLWPFGSVWWSLAAEIQFYLLLPWLHLLWRSPKFKWAFIPIILMGLFCYIKITRSLSNNFLFISSARDSILALWPTFLCGGILAAIHYRFREHIQQLFHQSQFLRLGTDALLFVVVILIGCALLKDAQLGPFGAYLYYFDHVLIEAVLWMLLIAGCLYSQGIIKHILTNKIFNFFGLISYSLYLVHFPVIFLGGVYLKQIAYISNNFSETGIIGICMLFGVAVASATYFLIEKPMLNLKAMLTRQIK